MRQSLRALWNTAKRYALPLPLLFLAGLVTVLGFQNSQLKREKAETFASIRYIHKNMWVPDFVAETTAGGSVRIGGAGGKRQILVFLSPSCRFCVASMPFINEIDRFSRTYNDIEVIGLTRTGGERMDAFIKQQGIRFPVAVITDARLINLLKFDTTPAVITVNTSGLITYAKVGMIESSKDAAIIMLNAVRMEATSPSALTRGPNNEAGT